MYPEYMLKMLRQRRGLDEDDTSMDDCFQTLLPSAVFDEMCNWEGLIGYGAMLRGWIEDLYGIETK